MEVKIQRFADGRPASYTKRVAGPPSRKCGCTPDGCGCGSTKAVPVVPADDEGVGDYPFVHAAREAIAEIDDHVRVLTKAAEGGHLYAVTDDPPDDATGRAAAGWCAWAAARLGQTRPPSVKWLSDATPTDGAWAHVVRSDDEVDGYGPPGEVWLRSSLRGAHLAKTAAHEVAHAYGADELVAQVFAADFLAEVAGLPGQPRVVAPIDRRRHP